VTNYLTGSALLLESLPFVSGTLTKTSEIEQSFSFTGLFPSEDPDESEFGSSSGLIIGIAISVLFVVILSFILLWCRKHRNDRYKKKSNGDLEGSTLQISLCDEVLENDTMFTTYLGSMTEEYETLLPASLMGDTNVSLTGTLSIG
jgi:tetrahydromethanopterin S-methyltransferase subunit F